MGSFTFSLRAFAAKAGKNADLIVSKTVLDIGTRIVERSPVGDRELWAANIERAERGLPPLPKGYVGGRFRANWQYGNYGGNGIPMTQLENIDPTGAVSIERIRNGLPPEGAAGMRHVLINNLPYAQPLEDGHSTQAPSGMVGLTVLEFKDIVDAVAAEVPK